MRLGQVAHHLGEQLQSDEEAVQRIVVEFVAAREDFIEHLLVVLDVAQHQAHRERGLVAEVIEEAALGDADRGDDLVDRGRGETLREHRRFGDFEDAGARIELGLSDPAWLALYQEYSFSFEPFPRRRRCAAKLSDLARCFQCVAPDH